MLPFVLAHTRVTTTTLFNYLRRSQHEHSVRAALLAQESEEYGNDAEVVIAALLYDVGSAIPAAEKAPLTGPVEDEDHTNRQHHRAVGQRYLRKLGFSERVCALVEGFVDATDAGSCAGLSDTDESLEYQQNKAFQNKAWLDAKLAVRRWNEQAKATNTAVPVLECFEQLAYECLLESRSNFTLHSREYRLPQTPTVVLCIDGFDPSYLTSGLERNLLPTFKSIIETGFHATAKSCMPSFTNPNNVSIITGAPPSIHGIAGNFFLDRETGRETMITDDTLLRGDTLLQKLSERGVRVAAITAKDKLRKILAHGLQRPAICFSAERAADCTLEENGIKNVENWLGRRAPSQYSADLSFFVLDAGVKLLQEARSDFLYLTLSDYIQHKHEPGSKEADEFMQAIDNQLGQIVSRGVTVAVTGDHGMSAKSTFDRQPNVLFLEDVLNKKFGAGSARVICPITDPFVRHHGALGSFVRVYLRDLAQLEAMLAVCRSLPEVEIALNREDAARKYEIPFDREADIVVISTAHTVIGSGRAKHDLSKVRDHPLRSHGGLSEQSVPVLLRPARVPRSAEHRSWRNYDIFDLALNWSS
ncbi:alkaline-phosphatase-like protein [Aspergillus karnatakaensis]|uniref:alkaline-phosphatase-like protein n=1 Tax=Aspergillus karnatakaensis TaxID=1810916 RepID=UPI003CCD000E